MSSLTEVLPLIIGTPVDDMQIFLLYLFAGTIGTICFMFFLKLFLLIAGYTKAR